MTDQANLYDDIYRERHRFKFAHDAKQMPWDTPLVGRELMIARMLGGAEPEPSNVTIMSRLIARELHITLWLALNHEFMLRAALIKEGAAIADTLRMTPDEMASALLSLGADLPRSGP